MIQQGESLINAARQGRVAAKISRGNSQKITYRSMLSAVFALIWCMSKKKFSEKSLISLHTVDLYAQRLVLAENSAHLARLRFSSNQFCLFLYCTSMLSVCVHHTAIELLATLFVLVQAFVKHSRLPSAMQHHMTSI